MAFFFSLASTPAFAGQADYVAMIMLDGFRKDYLAMYDLPNIRQLVQDGTWVAEAYGVFPSNTTPNQTSFVTGALPSVTNVPNNKYYDRLSDRVIPAPRGNKALTVVDAFKAAGRSTAVVNHFVVISQADTGVEGRVDKAVSLIRDKKPNLLVYYNSWTDGVGHKFGPYSEEMRNEAVLADQEIGCLVNAYRQAGILDKTLFVIASDHSMASLNAPAIPVGLEPALTGAGFKVAVNPTGAIGDANVVIVQIGSSFVYLRDPSKAGKYADAAKQAKNQPPEVQESLKNYYNSVDPAAYERLLQVVKGLPKVSVYDRNQISGLGSNPVQLGDVVVAPEPGYLMVPSSGKGGIHGRPQESGIFCLFSGAGVKHQSIVQSACITDIVPTILSIAGIPQLPTATGVVIDGIGKQ